MMRRQCLEEVELIKIPDEMRLAVDNALGDGAPCILATASPDGSPGVGLRGSMMVFSDDCLAYWERSKRAGLAHVESNPHVVAMYRNPQTRKAWKFFGRAKIYRASEVREKVMARVVPRELERDPERTRYAVIVEVDRIELMNGEVLQSRG